MVIVVDVVLVVGECVYGYGYDYGYDYVVYGEVGYDYDYGYVGDD